MHRLLRSALGAAAAAVPLVAATAASGSAAAAAGGKEGEVYAWGSASFGETGHGMEATAVGVPTRVDVLRGHGVVAVSAPASGPSSAALTADGRVYTWGCGRDARLCGVDAGVQNQLAPRAVEGLPAGDRVVQVALGEYMGVVRTASGGVYGWGRGAAGHDGGKTGAVGAVAGLSGQGVSAVAAGREHCLAVDGRGRVWAWGVNTSYAPMTGVKEEVKVPRLVGGLLEGRVVTAVAAGREHSLFLTDDGAVYAAGTDFFGQCGQGMATPYVKTPARVGGELTGKRVVAVVAGENHSLALTADGGVYVWGMNKDGALGTGHRNDIGVPRLLDARLPGRVTALAAGGGHTLLLTADPPALYAVGRGRSGQLGRGDSLESMAAYRTEPVLVAALPPGAVTSIAAGRDHSLAVVAAAPLS